MSPNNDDRLDSPTVKSYLLGTLDVERRAEFEERILCDAESFEELLATEEELIDQYLSGALSSSEQQQFENHFLASAERNKKLRFGRHLKRYLGSNPGAIPRERPKVETRSREISTLTRKPTPRLPTYVRAVVLSGAVITLICLSCVWWYSGKRSAGRVGSQSSQLVLVVSLAPGSIRSGDTLTQRVPVPPKGYDIKLELELTHRNFRNYKSEIFRENESLRVSDALPIEEKGDQLIVPVTVSGDMLSPGDYQVRLSGILESGSNEFIDNYSFRVIK